MAGKRRMGFKPSLREQLAASNSAQSFYASLLPLDDPRRAENERRLQAEREAIKPVRERAKPVQREAPVVAAISELLATNPRVLIALRVNSGMASYEAKTGKYAPVWFHKWLRSPEKMRMSDFFGLMDDPEWSVNPRCIPLAIEAKAPGWKKPSDDREREQAAFLSFILNCGGRAGFATSVEEAQRIIEGN